MGITGLLPLLKEQMAYVEVSDLSGMKMGVDGYSWLYKAITSCGPDVYMNPTDPSVINRYVNLCVRKCKALLSNGVQLYFVFDGEEHPMKKETNQRRRRKKMEIQEKIEMYLEKGKLKEAKGLMSRCLKVDSFMVDRLIDALKEMKIPYMIAPYEADPQLVYLEREGHIDCIITEDSDLIVYGAKKVLFKLSETQGGELYNREKILSRCSESVFCLISKIQEIVSMCGCDYTDGINKVGLITAHKLIMTYDTVDKAIEYLAKKYGDRVMAHIDVSSKVICTFNMHVVKDPLSRERVHLKKGTEKEISIFDDISFLGILEPVL